jgi:hypothetical protein
MPVREGPPEPPPYPAEKARSGEIIRRASHRRLIFVGGLLGFAIPLLLLALLR